MFDQKAQLKHEFWDNFNNNCHAIYSRQQFTYFNFFSSMGQLS